MPFIPGESLGYVFPATVRRPPRAGAVVQQRRVTLRFLLASLSVLRTLLSPLPSPSPLFPPHSAPPPPYPSPTHSYKAFVQNDTTPAVRQDNQTLVFQSLKGYFFKTFPEFHKSLELSKAVRSSKEATSTRYTGKSQQLFVDFLGSATLSLSSRTL